MTRTAGLTGIMAAALMVVLADAGANVAAERQGANASVRSAIEEVNKKFAVGATKGDSALMASAYTEDAIAYPANAEAVKGRGSIQAMWKSVLDSGVNGIQLSTAEVESAGDLAYETGTYVMKIKDGSVVDQGKYVVVWKRVNGQWLLHRDIWTTNLPPAKK